MRLVFAGTPQLAVPALEKIFNTPELEVVAVLTKPNLTRVRGNRQANLPVENFALAHHIPILTPENPNDINFCAKLRDLAPDCCPVVAYGNILKPSLLEIPKYGWVNLHFSLLPAWRGAAPVPAAIRAGDQVTGVTTFQIGPGLDDGPIFGQITEEIKPTDNATSLLNRLAWIGADLLVTTLEGIAKQALDPQPQDETLASYAPKITKKDVEINWNLPAHIVARLVRASALYPGAWCNFRDQMIKIIEVQEITHKEQLQVSDNVSSNLLPGQILLGKRNIYIKTADNYLELLTLQAPGKPKQSAIEWARGARITSGAQW